MRRYFVLRNKWVLYFKFDNIISLWSELNLKYINKRHSNIFRLKLGRVSPVDSILNLPKKCKWVELSSDQVKILLRKGKLSEGARVILFKEFGSDFLGLTNFEREYFTTNFKSKERLLSFLKSHNFDFGGSTFSFKGHSIFITKTKIRKALRELYNEEG